MDLQERRLFKGTTTRLDLILINPGYYFNKYFYFNYFTRLKIEV